VACTATVTLDTVGAVQQTSVGAPNLSQSIGGPTSTDANTLLVAKIMFDGTTASVSSCTWNSVSMTSAGTAASNATKNASYWYLLNPASSTQTLACTGTNVLEYYFGMYSFKNVNATTPIRAGTYQTATGNSTSASMTITSNSQDISISEVEAAAYTSTNQTTAGSSNAGTFGAGADLATTPASSVTHTHTVSTGTWAMTGMSVHCK